MALSPVEASVGLSHAGSSFLEKVEREIDRHLREQDYNFLISYLDPLTPRLVRVLEDRYRKKGWSAVSINHHYDSARHGAVYEFHFTA